MKIAVIGLGFMGRTHLQAFRGIPEAEVVAVASDDPIALSGDLTAAEGNLGTAGEKFDFSSMRKYSDWQGAVRDPGAEAVDICLPTFLHAPAAIAALEAGKHVLVEKPLALNGGEADKILEAADKSGRVLMTAQVLRFFPDYLRLIELNRSGKLGPARSAVFRRRCSAPAWGLWLPDPAKSGGGVFDLLIHDVDMAVHLFGNPAAISATGYEDLSKGIDFLACQLHYPDGPAVMITGGWHHPKSYPFSMEYTVSFDGGTVEYSSAGRPPKLYRADGREETLRLSPKDGYYAEIEYFIECIINNRKPERCPPHESAVAVRLTRMLAEARPKDGEKIPCSL